jgi:hypothetical protein
MSGICSRRHHFPIADPGGSGYEIVREALACRACAEACRTQHAPLEERPQARRE